MPIIAEQHRLIVKYYREQKSAKIKTRQELAKSFGISAIAPQVKACRIRVRLKDCEIV